MIADLAIHDKKDGNPHAHIMLTTRNVTQKGFIKKERVWNDRRLLNEWRENWAKMCNSEFEEKQINAGIDNRTLRAQGIEREPTIHLGKAAVIEKQGIETDRGNINREIKKSNEKYQKIEDEIERLEAERFEEAERIIGRIEETRRKTGNIYGQIKYYQESLESSKRSLKFAEEKLKKIQQKFKKEKEIEKMIEEFRRKQCKLGFFEFREKNKIEKEIKRLQNQRELYRTDETDKKSIFLSENVVKNCKDGIKKSKKELERLEEIYREQEHLMKMAEKHGIKDFIEYCLNEEDEKNEKQYDSKSRDSEEDYELEID